MQNIFWKIQQIFVGEASQCEPLPKCNFGVLEMGVKLKMLVEVIIFPLYC